MTADLVRVLLEHLADPAYAGLFEDALAKRAAAADEAEPSVMRGIYSEQAGELLGELAEALAAEVALREAVPA